MLSSHQFHTGDGYGLEKAWIHANTWSTHGFGELPEATCKLRVLKI